MIRLFSTAFAMIVLSLGYVAAQSRSPPAQQSQPRPSALGNFGTSNKEPIKIDADRLDVFDKEQRAVFTGSVVAMQGESTIKCTELTVLYEQQRGQARTATPAATPGEGAIRR